MTPHYLLHLWTVLVLASAITIALRSDFYILATKLLRNLGWKKNEDGFWPAPVVYDYWVLTQWSTWAHERAINSKFWFGFLHLIHCPYCIAVHCSWIAGAVWWCVAGWQDALVTWAYPVVILNLYTRTKN